QPAAAQGPVPDDAGAQQWGRLNVGKTVGQGVREALVDNRVLGIPAVVVPSGEPRRHAEVLVTPAAVRAHTTRVTQQRDPDARTDVESSRAGTARVDAPDDLVAG